MASSEVNQRDVYEWFGRAAYEAQCFEVELRSLLLYMSLLDIPNDEQLRRQEYENLSKIPLGGLLKRLRTTSSLDPKLEELLAIYRGKRNYLIHHFFFDHAMQFPTQSGRRKMVAELKELDRIFSEADSVASAMSESFRDAVGIPEEKLHDFVRSQILEEAGVDIENLT